jgi:hypothetical protein
MVAHPEEAIRHYTQAYQRLYQRPPANLKVIDHNWVIVSGARMRITELNYLTKQLQEEYFQGLKQRRSVVKRLIKWFKG